MRKITIEELKQLAADARESIWEQAGQYNREPKVYLHWTAGHYDQPSNSYHICITGDGEVYLMHDLDEVTNGTWRRNTGAVNIAICGCWDAGSNDLGSEPPTELQLEALYQAIAVVCEGLWLTVNKEHVMTHGEAANNEDGDWSCHNPYSWWNDSYNDGDTRGDLEYLGTDESPSYNPYATDGSRGGDVLRGKAQFYVEQMRGE